MIHHLLFSIALFLAAAIVMVAIAKKLGLGGVMGYLIAGMAIGPQGLGWIGDVDNVLELSEFGVVLLMFAIGLELSPRKLWSMRGSVIGGGSLQVVGVAAVLAAIAFSLGQSWQAAVIIGAGLCLSSTAIALTSFTERRLLKTSAGEAGFAILLFQDMAAIPIIAAIPLLAAHSAAASSTPGWLLLLRAAGVFILLFVCGRFLINPLLRQMARTGLREIFTAFALLLVVSSALLMQSIGTSMALGAFLAGILLADSEYRHALEADIEPFKGLLLGLFFMAVGMSVDFAVLRHQPWLIIGLTMGFVGIKLALMSLISKLLKIPRGQCYTFAALLSQGGEFAFVVFGAAATAGLLEEKISTILTLVVTLSMAITPLLMLGRDGYLKIRSRFATDNEAADADEGIAPNDGRVIIAGFGRFGQITGRLLSANGIRPTVLDYDADQVEFLRAFGFQVFYGDANRLDLLERAGISEARLLIVAIDNPESSVKLIKLVRKHFPDLQIAARVRNVSHYYDVFDLNVQAIERETFESALMLGRRSLEILGLHADTAVAAADRFRAHNLQTMQDMLPHRHDRKKIQSLAKRARQELEENVARDSAPASSLELKRPDPTLSTSPTERA